MSYLDDESRPIRSAPEALELGFGNARAFTKEGGDRAFEVTLGDERVDPLGKICCDLVLRGERDGRLVDDQSAKLGGEARCSLQCFAVRGWLPQNDRADQPAQRRP